VTCRYEKHGGGEKASSPVGKRAGNFISQKEGMRSRPSSWQGGVVKKLLPHIEGDLSFSKRGGFVPVLEEKRRRKEKKGVVLLMNGGRGAVISSATRNKREVMSGLPIPKRGKGRL